MAVPFPPVVPISEIQRRQKMIQDEEKKRSDPKNYPDLPKSSKGHKSRRSGGKAEKVK